MTNLIQQIETNSLKNNNIIKDKSKDLKVLIEIYGKAKTNKKTDEFREWCLFDTIGKQFAFIFDEKGKKGKMVMSQHAKNISNGLMAIYKTEFVEKTNLFTNWAIDIEYKKGNNVSSFTKMSSNLTSYKKYLNPPNEGSEGGNEGSEGGNEGSEGGEPLKGNSPKITMEQLFDYLDTLDLKNVGITLDHLQERQALLIKEVA
tara:strand:- start:106 stop:711 length:606 start_codon:yes stop_codon:yes gene_type:complete